MTHVTETTDFVARAERVYEERWKAQLEPGHLGEVIAIEPDSGECVLAKTLRELDAVRRAKFGTKWVHIFRVGGGAAVTVGRAFRHARVS